MAAKIFEVNDVLPATTQLKISWDSGLSSFLNRDAEYRINLLYLSFALIIVGDFNLDGERTVLRVRRSTGTTPSDWVYIYEVSYDYPDGWFSPYTDYSGGHNYVVIDTSLWNESQRTIESITRDFQDTGLSSLDCFYWEDLNAPTGYTITFNSNGGSSISSINNATELPTLPTPTKSGYTFVAWYYESDFQTRAKAGDTIEANTTLYAKWHNLGSLFTEIADAIRSKDGTSETIRDVDFGERVKQIQGAKEEETKTVTPNFSSGNVVVTPTSGKVMTQVTINKDSNLIADNIKKDITVHGITGTLQPAKEEETKTVTPNFSSGNQVITPTSGKVLSQVTLTKPTDLIPENIAKDKNVCGVVGTLESGGGGYTVTFTDNTFHNEYFYYHNGIPYTDGGIHYSFDNGVTYHPITRVKSVITDSWEIVPAKLMNVTQIRFKIVAIDVYDLWVRVGNVLTPPRQSGNWSAESNNITLSSDVTYGLKWMVD